MSILIFDIGGTNIRVSVSKDGRRLGRVIKRKTPRDWKLALEWIAETGHDLAAGRKITKASGGIAGPLDLKKQTILNAPNLKSWHRKPIQQTLQKLCKAPVVLANDAALAALGEARQGAGKGKRIVAYLTISTGVGGARVVHGNLDQTTYGFEPGKVYVNDKPLEVMEDWAGAGLQKRYGRRSEDIRSADVWRMVTRRMAIGLHDILVLWNPEVVVLGGGLMRRLSTQAISQQLRVLHYTYPTLPKIVRSRLGDQAGLIGALENLRT